MELAFLYVVAPEYDRRWPSLLESITPLAARGVQRICISLRNPGYFDYRDQQELNAVRRALDVEGVQVACVEAACGRTRDISSPDDAVHEDGVVALIDAIELAGLTGADVVILQAGGSSEGANKRRLDRARGVLREMAVLACDASVFVALRNSPAGQIAHDPLELLKLIDAVGHDNVGVFFDCGAAMQTGDFADVAAQLLPLAIAAGVYDVEEGSQRRLFPGEGIVPWISFISALSEVREKPELVVACGPPKELDWAEGMGQLEEMLNAN